MRPGTKTLVSLGISAYLGSIAGNTITHTMRVYDASEQLEQDHYGPNLRAQWTQYRSQSISEMFSPKIFIPFSAWWDIGSRPMEIRKIGQDSGLNIQFDIKN